ncbi:MAG: Uma2 family endonuclease [Turneriella sp.]|nr:Uma2 family endonuclease [Turneriella sp.]
MKGLTADLVQILADPQVRENVGLLTYEQYFAAAQRGELPEKTELLEGMVFHSMPKSPLHANILSILTKKITAILKTGYVVRPESPLAIPQAASVPEPDIMVCRGSEADYWHQHPQTAELVIEIAVTSTSLDRYKAKLYALAGVREYWLLDAESRRLEIFHEPKDGRYLKVEITEDEVVSRVLPQLRFPLGEVLPPR